MKSRTDVHNLAARESHDPMHLADVLRSRLAVRNELRAQDTRGQALKQPLRRPCPEPVPLWLAVVLFLAAVAAVAWGLYLVMFVEQGL